MATQGLPIISGGPDANNRVGNIFLLWTVDVDREEREAAQAAAKAYLELGAPDAKSEKPKAVKGKSKKKKATPVVPDPSVFNEPAKSPAVLPTVLVLFPEISNDTEERERSQAALFIWCSLTKRMAIANSWRMRMAAIGAKGFAHPDRVLAIASGRAAIEERDAAVKAEIRAKREEDEGLEGARQAEGDEQQEPGDDQAQLEAGDGEIVDQNDVEVERERVTAGDHPGIEPRNANVRFTPAEIKALGLDKEFIK